MRRFERSDEATDTGPASERLETFTKAIYDALVPASGACASVQGELVRANDRICSENLRNGMANYYNGAESIEANYYGALLLFLLETMIENRNRPLDDEDIAYFTRFRERLEPDRTRTCRLTELEAGDGELAPAEEQELAALSAEEASADRPGWDELYNRAQRCIANWCMANPGLVDRHGRPVEQGALRDLTALI